MSTKKEMNEDRAKIACLALAAFAKKVGLNFPMEMKETVTDFLADLMHYCSEENLDFDSLLKDAKAHFESEDAEEESDEEPCDVTYSKENPR